MEKTGDIKAKIGITELLEKLSKARAEIGAEITELYDERKALAERLGKVDEVLRLCGARIPRDEGEWRLDVVMLRNGRAFLTKHMIVGKDGIEGCGDEEDGE